MAATAGDHGTVAAHDRDSARLRQLAWRTPNAVYYVTNTLDRKLTNAQMLAIAASLRRLNG